MASAGGDVGVVVGGDDDDAHAAADADAADADAADAHADAADADATDAAGADADAFETLARAVAGIAVAPFAQQHQEQQKQQQKQQKQQQSTSVVPSRSREAGAAAWGPVFRERFILRKSGGAQREREQHEHPEEEGNEGGEHDDEDDLVYFVGFPSGGKARRRSRRAQQPSVFVRRRVSSTAALAEVLGDATVLWEESFWLNFLMHDVRYFLEVSVRLPVPDAPPSRFYLAERVRRQVFARIEKVRIDVARAESPDFGFPHLFFAVEDYREAFDRIILEKDGDRVCAELFAAPKAGGAARARAADAHGGLRRIFSGGLVYEALCRECRDQRAFWRSKDAEQQHTLFFQLRGPRGRGEAEMAVARYGFRVVVGRSDPASASPLLRKKGVRGAVGEHLLLSCWLAHISLRWEDIVRTLLFPQAADSGGRPPGS